jgi:hypothetical protein
LSNAIAPQERPWRGAKCAKITSLSGLQALSFFLAANRYYAKLKEVVFNKIKIHLHFIQHRTKISLQIVYDGTPGIAMD